MTRKKKRFDVVKHLRRLSRSTLHTPQGRPIQLKKPKLLDAISRREAEARDMEES